MAYSEKVIDHYENPRNVGSFDNSDENVGSGMVAATTARRTTTRGEVVVAIAAMVLGRGKRNLKRQRQ